MIHDAMRGFPLEREKYKVFITENTWVPAEFTEKTVEEYKEMLWLQYESEKRYESIYVVIIEMQIHHIKGCDNVDRMKLIRFEVTTKELIEYAENEVDVDINTFNHYAVFYEGDREEWFH